MLADQEAIGRAHIISNVSRARMEDLIFLIESIELFEILKKHKRKNI